MSTIEELERIIARRKEMADIHEKEAAYMRTLVTEHEAELARLRAEQQRSIEEGWREVSRDAEGVEYVQFVAGHEERGRRIVHSLAAHIETEATKQATERIATLEKQLEEAVDLLMDSRPVERVEFATEGGGWFNRRGELLRAIREGSK